MENDECLRGGCVAVRSVARANGRVRDGHRSIIIGYDFGWSWGFFVEGCSDFRVRLGLTVTLVRQRSLPAMHFFLDFIFH